MGTYFPLFLKDPVSTSHSSTPIHYMNFPSSSEPYSHSCMDVPAVASESHTSSTEVMLSFGGSWKDGRNEMVMIHEAGGSSSLLLQGAPNLQGQGLSLSLSTHVPYQNGSADFSSILGDSDMSSYGLTNTARTFPNSKYLRAAQDLLDEVVSVKKGIKVEGELKDGGSDPSATPKAEASAAEKQELQNRLTKLLPMLDEVERRYRQYYHQMQIVVSSFDAMAGSGAAKPYTALALQTISRHFRCLRDAINGQIQAARSSLGEEEEEDGAAASNGGISRLLRQQRALKQLGMMQSLKPLSLSRELGFSNTSSIPLQLPERF